MKLAETKRKLKLKLIVAFPLDVAFTILRKAVVRLLKTIQNRSLVISYTDFKKRSRSNVVVT